MSDFDRARNAGYDDLMDAIEDGEGYYLACKNDHGWLPPRRICPECGERDFTKTPLPSTGEIKSYTVIHVSSPSFSEDTPYVTALADFGPVRVTGIMHDVDPAAVESGIPVTVTVGERRTTGERTLAFELE